MAVIRVQESRSGKSHNSRHRGQSGSLIWFSELWDFALVFGRGFGDSTLKHPLPLQCACRVRNGRCMGRQETL